MPERSDAAVLLAHWASVHRESRSRPADLAAQLAFSQQELVWLGAFATPKKQKTARRRPSSAAAAAAADVHDTDGA